MSASPLSLSEPHFSYVKLKKKTKKKLYNPGMQLALAWNCVMMLNRGLFVTEGLTAVVTKTRKFESPAARLPLETTFPDMQSGWGKRPSLPDSRTTTPGVPLSIY